MRHLSPAALLDIAEDPRLESSAPHLARCAACRRQIETARGMLTVVDTVDAPEPSPLFWDHLSARVRDAVAAEASPQPVRPWGWLSWRWTAAVSAAVVMLAIGLVFKSAPTPLPTPVPVEADALASVYSERGSLQDDPSLSLIADLAGELNLDGAVEAGLMVRSETAEGVLTGLSVEERVELRRLLTEELAGREQIF